ncbi:MAG: DUF2029 domain-containing protein [Planctomycetes bacterium]|nr:DUF2029 domain-containing protein [Planctomycetota bacterium]
MTTRLLLLWQSVVLALAFVVLWSIWGSLTAFGERFDATHPILFCDFDRHFHPVAVAMLSHLDPSAAANLPPGNPFLGYFYPPTTGLLLMPLGYLPVASAKVVYGALQFAAALVLCLLPAHLIRERPAWIGLGTTALTALSVPVLQCCKWGQVSTPSLALVLLAFALDARGRQWLAAGLLGLAIAIKLWPGIFVLPFVVQGRWRFLIGTAVSTVSFLLLLPIALFGFDVTMAFYREATGQMRLAAEVWYADDGSQYFANAVARWLSHLGIPFATTRPLLVPVAFGLVGGAVVLLAMALRRGVADRAWSLAVLACCPALLVVTSWLNYFVHLPLVEGFLVLAILQSGHRRTSRAILLVTTAVPAMLCTDILFLQWVAGGDARRFAAQGWLAAANLLVLVGLCVLLAGRLSCPRRAAN